MADAEKPTPPLEYAPPSSVSRRQFRVLLALTLLNTILLAGFVAGPVFVPFAKQQWQQFQEAREQRRREALRKAAYARAMNYTAPADQIVLEERPEFAAKMLAEGNSPYMPVRSRVLYLPPRPWQPPAVLKPPLQMQLDRLITDPRMPVVFLHALKDSAAQEQLVCVQLLVEQHTNGESNSGDERRYYLQTQRALVASVIFANGQVGQSILRLGRDRQQSWITWSRGASNWEHGQVDFHLTDQFRIYAGQPHQTDPAKFTIAYELDGKPGIIDGHLVNRFFVELVPRDGAIVNRAEAETVWDPHVAPITRPAATKAH